jgi:hypothetical protein
MPQKHRKTAKIMAVLLPDTLKEEIDAEVRLQNQGPGIPLDRSKWLKRAIRRDLAHARRSRVGRKSALELEREKAGTYTAACLLEQ